MSTDIIIEKMINEGVVLLKAKIRMKGKEKDAIMELNDTNLVMRSVTKNMISAKSIAMGCNAKTTPVRVATPLPPLKLAKRGKI